MPSAAEILCDLGDAANAWIAVAIAWHVVLGAAIVALLVGWRPSAWLAPLLLAGAALSVSIASAAFANPFNALSFAALVIALVAIARRAPARAVGPGPSWAVVIGAALIAFGWAYPHFLATGGARYLVAAPIGIVPCPTLAVIAGLALCGGGLGSRALVALLGAWTAFYAAFGIARLGVALDLGLAVAPLALAALLLEHRVHAAA
jgi:hypothetical protein